MSHAPGPFTAREEHDLLGSRLVPEAAYYGVHTLRATENFAITGIPIGQYEALVRALAATKQAAANANLETGRLASDKAAAIIAACEEIRAGMLHDQFTVDVIQGGAGTSSNMNANEVIANRALELLGYPRGAYEHLHPLEDVNLGQSTNDVYPTALRLALHELCDQLQHAMNALRLACAEKGRELGDVITLGRTQLQDAVPMTLGQTFTAFAVTIEEDQQRLSEAAALLREINLGGTAIGTGLNSHPEYAERARAELSRITGLELVTAPDLIEATQDTGAFVQLSGVLRRIAIKVSKICNDLRLLASGPQAGFRELQLPAVQAGSSIMPGKVNPVIPEAVNQVAFAVIGNDVTVSFAAEGGQLQLNAFEPIIAFRLFESISMLDAALTTLAERCIVGISVDRAQLQRNVEQSVGLATVLSPVIGYGRATEIVRDALTERRSIAAIAIERGYLTREQLQQLLDAQSAIQLD